MILPLSCNRKTTFYLQQMAVVVAAAIVLLVVCVTTTDSIAIAEAAFVVPVVHHPQRRPLFSSSASTTSRGRGRGFHSRSAATSKWLLHGTLTSERKGGANDDDDDNDHEKKRLSSSYTTRAASPVTFHRHDHDQQHPHRRHFLQQAFNSFCTTAAAAITTTTASASLLLPQPAHAARGLILFPLTTQPLSNKYHFMCAGTSLLQEQNIWSTNPLFLTNREDALSETGIRQVQAVCQTLAKTPGQFPTICYHSLAAKCMDTADMIGTSLQLGRERVVPEFTYLDGRGIGRWDNLQFDKVQPAVWALDVDQAGRDGVGGRPPPNNDGTPNETLADQMVRLRQFLSLLESRSSGDTILLIFPDGTGPALLCAMMAGIPYNKVHELEFAPGELRMDITPSSIQQWLQLRNQNEAAVAEYQAVIAKGRETLTQLRETDDSGEIVSFKDLKEKEERIAIDKAFQEEQEKKQRAAVERQRKLQAESQARKQQEAEARKQKQEAEAASSVSAMPSSSEDTFSDSATLLSPGLTAAGVAVLGGVAAAAAVGLGAGTDNKDDADAAAVSLLPTLSANNSTALLNFGTQNNVTTTFVEADGSPPAQSVVSNVTRVSGEDDYLPTPMNTLPDSTNNVTMRVSTGTYMEGSRISSSTTGGRKNGSMGDSEDSSINDQAVVSSRASELWEQIPVVNGDGGLYGTAVVDKVQEAQRAMDDYLDLDDGGQDWLQSLADIIAEPDDDVDSENDFQ